MRSNVGFRARTARPRRLRQWRGHPRLGRRHRRPVGSQRRHARLALPAAALLARTALPGLYLRPAAHPERDRGCDDGPAQSLARMDFRGDPVFRDRLQTGGHRARKAVCSTRSSMPNAGGVALSLSGRGPNQEPVPASKQRVPQTKMSARCSSAAGTRQLRQSGVCSARQRKISGWSITCSTTAQERTRAQVRNSQDDREIWRRARDGRPAHVEVMRSWARCENVMLDGVTIYEALLNLVTNAWMRSRDRRGRLIVHNERLDGQNVLDRRDR